MRAIERSVLVFVLALGVVTAGCLAERGGSEVGEEVWASVRGEDAGNLPFYARLSATEVYQDGEWAVVIFYRPAECIPAGFNLLDFLDFNAFACGPPTTDGFALYEDPDDFTPYHVQLHGLGAVPIWFIEWPEMQAAMADGVVTIGELGALPSLRVGSAARYEENLHPLGAANIGKLELVASGTLDDGSGFSLKIAQRDEVGRALVIHITFR